MSESLHDTISKAMDEVAGVDDSPRVTMQDSVEDAPEHVAAEPVVAEPKDRAEDGKFKAKASEAPKELPAQDAKAAEAQKISPEAKQDEAKGVKPDTQKADPTFEAPASWRKEVKEQWDKVPLPVRAEIQRRERESLAALNEANNKLVSREKEEGELGAVLAPFKTEWSARGIPTPQAIAQTLARAKYAYSNPTKFIQEFAAENGLSLDNLTQGQDIQDPQLSKVEQELNAIKQTIQSQTQQQEQSQRQQYANAVNAFADAKDEAGQAKNPHFTQVQDLMVKLMPMINQTEPLLGHGEKLAKAYEMACRAHPQVWQQMSEDNFVKTQTAKAQSEIEASKAAKSRAVSPASTSAGTGGDVSMRNLSLRDQIKLAMEGDGRV